MPPAARIGDVHVCPMVNGVVPHVGGPLSGPGAPTVMIGGKPAAIVGDLAVCVGPPDSAVMGEPTVKINHQMALRMGDSTAHGGTVMMGCPTVMIGSSVQGEAAKLAAKSGAVTCKECESK